MSYSFDGTNDWIQGSFSSTYGYPITIAVWVKISDHPTAIRVAAQLGNSNSSFNNSLGIRTSATDNLWTAASIGSGGGTASATNSASIDNTWHAFVATFTADNSRLLFDEDSEGTSSGAQTITQALQHISIGASLAGSQELSGLIAEVAIWNDTLTENEKDDYVAGTAASTISPSTLIGYWPLSSSNSTQSNQGIDASGDLSVSGAVYNADHPTISSGAPTFDTSPTVQSVSSTAYTISYNADANASNIYLGAYPKDASAPSAAQIKAGTNAHGTATEATTGNADTIVLTPSDNPPFPLYDIYAVLEGPGGFSNVVTLSDEYLNPTAGFQFVTIDVPFGAEEDSILEGASPAAADGDIIRCSTLTSPGSYTVNMLATGTFSFNPGLDSSRQSIQAHFYDVSTQAYSDATPVTFWVNNVPPEFNGNEEAYLFEKDVAITPIDVDTLFLDSEGDAIVTEILTALPTGLSESDNVISGTPTVYSRTDTTLRATDITGEFTEHIVTFFVGDRVPNVVGLNITDATTIIEAVASLTVANPPLQINSNIIPIGEVVAQDPVGNTLVPFDYSISLTISAGPTEIVLFSYPISS